MACPLAPRETWARGNHLSDAESALPGGGKPYPPISRTGAGAQQARGAQPHSGWSFCLCRSASPSHPGETLLHTPTPCLGCTGPASLSPLPTPPPQAPSASKISLVLSLPFKAIRTHRSSLLARASLPSVQATPESSLLPECPAHLQTDRRLHVFFPGPDALPSHPPLVPLLFQSQLQDSFIRIVAEGAADVPGVVQGTHAFPNHPPRASPAWPRHLLPGLIWPCPFTQYFTYLRACLAPPGWKFLEGRDWGSGTWCKGALPFV